MQNSNTAMRGARLLAWVLLCGLLFLPPTHTLAAQEPPAQASSQQAIGFTADFFSRVIFRDKDLTIMSGKLYAAPPQVRFEPEPEEPTAAYNEIQLYDFEQQKMRRVFLDDRIYFQIELSENARIKAMRDGWIPWKDHPNIKQTMIRLKEDFVNGHPCVLYLQERKIEAMTDNKTSAPFLEYSLIWEATDLKRLPVRIIYFPPNHSTVVVDYKNMKLADLDPPLFNPPEGFVNLSPF